MALQYEDPQTQGELVEAIKSHSAVLDDYSIVDVDITSDIADSDLYDGQIFADQNREKTPSFLENTQCGLSDDEKITFIECFTAWTGLAYGGGDDNGDKWNYGPDGYDEDERIYGKLSSTFWLTGHVKDLERAATKYKKRIDEGYTEQEMLDELIKVKNFLKDDLNSTLGLKGKMAELNSAMFIKDLDDFTEMDLMAYVELFHIDVSYVESVLETIDENYGKLSITADITEQDVDNQQAANEKIYLTALKNVVLEFKVGMLDRLRLWRWREEVLLSRTGDQLPYYPGMPIIYRFETASELLQNGIDSYFMRVGEIKRETLMDTYEYFDLYHMAGKLAFAHPNNVKFDTDINFEDLADLICMMVQDIEIDPRHIITPLGVYRIFNYEVGEMIFNLCDTKSDGHNISKLMLACSHAGIDLNTVTEIEETLTKTPNARDGVFILFTDIKPPNVLVEELTSQYLSPQFYTGVENNRDYAAALLTLKTLSGQRVMNANRSELIFYGVGDGLSKYNVFTPKELTNVFNSYKSFFNPYSIKDNPEDPFRLIRFSAQSIKRLLTIVIPRMRETSHSTSHKGKILSIEPTIEEVEERVANVEETGEFFRKDLDDLEQAILDNFETIDKDDPETIDYIIKPRGKNYNIIEFLKSRLDDFQTNENEEPINLGLRADLGLFFAHLYQLGIQFSDWDNFVELNEDVVKSAILSDYKYKRVNPEWSIDLTEKIFNMVTVEIEKYFNIKVVRPESKKVEQVINSEEDLQDKVELLETEPNNRPDVDTSKADAVEDYSGFVRALRLVKFYNGAYRIDWNDELSTIQGQLRRVIQANDIGLYEYIRMSGNWFISTASYYSIAILGVPITNNIIDVVGYPSTIQDILDSKNQDTT